MTTAVLTAHDLADRLRCSPRKARELAIQYGLGINLGGRAGYRFTEADVDALWEAMRPVQEMAPARRRRRS